MSARTAVKKRADVYRDGELAGRIDRAPHGSVFSYGRSFLDRHAGDPRGIAFHLPLRAEPFPTFGVNLHPFFANLLPEGARLAALLGAVKAARDDLLSLLVAAGSDTVGDVSVVPEGKSPEDSSPITDLSRVEELSFEELFERSIDYSGRGYDRATVQGAQRKVSASVVSSPVRAFDRRSAYILKLGAPDLPRLVENEAFFMRAATDAGIETASTHVVRDRQGEPGLIVTRFDRRKKPRRGVTKVHQEDACQLLDRYPADKYAVALADVARALGACAAPIPAVAALIRLHAFSYVIANGDLHAKNVSVYASPRDGRIAMAPAYDLLSTLPYGDDRMALALDGRDKKLERAHFVAFGARHGVRAPAVAAILDRVCDAAPAWMKRLGEIGLDPRKTAHLEQTMRSRRDDLR